MRDGSYGLGATQSETIRRVLLPAALPGIVGAFLLAVSRAIGETMIVVLAAGNSPVLRANPLEPISTVTVSIVNQLTGDTDFAGPQSLVAFALGPHPLRHDPGLNVVALYHRPPLPGAVRMTDTPAAIVDTALDCRARRKLVRASLRRRHNGEMLFRGLGLTAIVAGAGLRRHLLLDHPVEGRALVHAAGAACRSVLRSRAVITNPVPPVQAAGQSDADFRAANLKWQRDLAGLNWNRVVEASLRRTLPAGTEIDSRQVLSIVETSERHRCAKCSWPIRRCSERR
jgi:hypothetical protein